MNADYRLQDLIDLPKLQSILDSLYVSSGIPSALVDLEGNILTGSGWQDICTKFHRVHPETLKDCLHSDVTIIGSASSGLKQTQITCPRGLTDTATPLVIEGRHLANVFTGQLFLERPDREVFRKQAQQWRFDEATYLEAFDRVPVITQKELDDYLSFITQLTELLALQGLTQKRSLEVQEALRKSDALYRSLFENMLNGFAYCRMLFEDGKPQDFIYLAVNEAFEKQTGLKRVVGRKVSEVIPGIREADPQLFERYGRVALTGQPERFELFLEALQEWFWVSVYSPAKEHFVAVFDVITERKRTEEQVRRSEAALREAQRVSHTGSWFWHVQSDHLEWSDEMYRLFGYEPGSITGKLEAVIAQAIHPDDREKVERANRSVMDEGRPEAMEYRVIWPDQTVHWVWAEPGKLLLDEAGRPKVLSGIVQDVNDRKVAEEEKVQLQAQLMQAQKMESLGALAGGVAHDMNNVLGAILGLASANLEAQPAGSSAHKAFQTVIRAAERGGKMVKSLLSFARQSPAEDRELDLNELLQEEVHLLERTTLAKVRLELDLATDLRSIRGDASALTHAFMNLCVNAVDAMPENGTLTLRTRNVDPDWIEVVVQDTGSGMPREVLEKALDPFFSTKPAGKGTGLGLSMVYSTVKAHRGQLEIQSEPGHGTRVRLRFPVCEAVVRAADPTPVRGSEALNRAFCILVVDDDELIRCTMAPLLEMLGHTALAVASGEEALAELERGFQPDVVILDMNMPGLGGAGTLPRLRALRPELPVLLATGLVDENAEALAMAHPGVTLLPKPFSLIEVQQGLESCRRVGVLR